MSYSSVLSCTDYRASIARTPTKRELWKSNAHIELLHPEGAALEFVKRIFNVSDLSELENAELTKRFTPFATFFFGLETYKKEMFDTLTLPVSYRSLIFCYC